MLKEAIFEYPDERLGGVRNHELAVELGLEYLHEERAYLIYSVLGILMIFKAV